MGAILVETFTVEYRIGAISYDKENDLDEAWKVMKLFNDSRGAIHDGISGLRIAGTAPGKYIISSAVPKPTTVADLLASVDELLKPHGWQVF